MTTKNKNRREDKTKITHDLFLKNGAGLPRAGVHNVSKLIFGKDFHSEP